MRGARAVPSMGNPLGKKATNTHCDESKRTLKGPKTQSGGSFGVCEGYWEVERNGKRELGNRIERENHTHV